MRYDTLQDLPPPDFKRLTGVQRGTFALMLDVLTERTRLFGRPRKLSLADQLLLTLCYWREYCTLFHTAQDYGVSEATACRIVHKVENVLIHSERLHSPGRLFSAGNFSSRYVELISYYSPEKPAMLFVIPAPVQTPPYASGAPVNAAPFGAPQPDSAGVVWEDPREIHRVVVTFQGDSPPPARVRLEYWTSRWPEQRLPKDREPGGGEVGWWELGNWYRGEWRAADTEVKADGPVLTFTFRPLNAREFPNLDDYPVTFRYTLKIRVTSDEPLPPVESIAAYTDSVWERQTARVVWKEAPRDQMKWEAFNGAVEAVEKTGPRAWRIVAWAAANPDPNTFDKTLVTVRRGQDVFTFRLNDLADGPLFLPEFGAAVLPDGDTRDYAVLAAEQKARGAKTLYDRVAAMPEQTWRAAWAGMPPKNSPIYLPLGLDGGRQRFRLNADGSVEFRTNDHFLRARPGKDTPRLDVEAAPAHVRFGLPDRPVNRNIMEESLPICRTVWDADGVRVTQEAFVTALEGTQADGPVPLADTTAVFLARFTFTNPTDAPKPAALNLEGQAGGRRLPLHLDGEGWLRAGENVRGQLAADGAATDENGRLRLARTLAPGETKTVTVKLPYVVLTEPGEKVQLAALDFVKERVAVAGYWRRLDKSAKLLTPEPMLNAFYRAHAGHLLVNCEREPGSDRRFARVGSFAYGAYGNESCMMVVDLDRRGYHKEAQECLDAWLHYQGTVGLPGDFSSQQGVLYGAGGYEAGGYNQHHGWILWCMAEHYRFTRNTEWLKRAAPGILAGAEWIIRERARTAKRSDLARGLLPAGSLEDIGDWWPWLSTNCYTWRGLDAAAWALGQIQHPEATRLRKEADAYHTALLKAFFAARDRSPVVRLRDGTAVPKVPSQVYRRGRSFGWICETLEGALHLLITRALDPRSPEAEWILKDYEDNLYLSNQYGYTVPDFEKQWFGRGGMSMQACLLLDVEPYLVRDDVKNALRAMFNAIAVGYFPDVKMLTEHALPNPGDWRGDHYKSSDESNAAGWLRYLFVREEGEELLLGQAVPREWLKPGQKCGIERAATWFGPMSLLYTGGENEIKAALDGPRRNPPKAIRLRFRNPDSKSLSSVTVNGKEWKNFQGEWVLLPGDIGKATVTARWKER
jgi:hypothetical protein